MAENSTDLKKGLYIVPTPIGNLADITLRALEILKNSNYILCEDTRTSKKLLEKYKINSKMISNHKFNEKKNLTKILDFLKSGLIISLISDAGTPGVSDPGLVLVKECLKNDVNIIPLPGASAVTSAISISGFSDKFFFYGFFPDKLKIIDDDLSSLSSINSSIVFFISPKKINKAIPYIKKNFSGRNILICREMTKFYEEFIRTSVDDLEEFNQEVKGELTIVISEKNEKKKASQELSESDKRNIKNMMNNLSIKEIVNLPYLNKRFSKKKIYNYCLKLKNEN
jgi:16S rRNA (cytidine1402-2'-O)-methyltransferase|tara:strand:+ start:3932 stop:4783 length:852 start_codon:yes stop_codon:yes gene_type:complete